MTRKDGNSASWWTWVRTAAALLLILGAVAVLERARSGVSVRSFTVGATPVTAFATAGAEGPTVVVAHGFAGSRQMMQGYALALARAGYRVFAFDFLGHGRNPVPMSGDVTAPEGTTRLLVEQANAVIDAVAEGPARTALLGHSMATDILARVAADRGDIGPVILLSAYSRAIDATVPATLLLVTGAWEPGLRDFALDAARMVAPGTVEGETAIAGPVSRRAVIAPYADHVSILHSEVGRRAALDWLDRAYGRVSETRILQTGWAILGLLGGLVLLFGPVVRLIPGRPVPGAPLGPAKTAVAALLPAVAAPLLAVPIDPEILPVLVADYLSLHLAIFGAVQLALIRYWGLPIGRPAIATLGLLLAWCVLFGVALDRYAANFWPTGGRIWIMVAIGLGAVPFMLADAILTHRAPLVRRLALRAGFLCSLGIAVALDFEELFFLIMIAPVIVLFYLVFGTMGQAAGRRSGPVAPGLALGLVLAWTLGVSFPLFQG